MFKTNLSPIFCFNKHFQEKVYTVMFKKRFINIIQTFFLLKTFIKLKKLCLTGNNFNFFCQIAEERKAGNVFQTFNMKKQYT